MTEHAVTHEAKEAVIDQGLKQAVPDAATAERHATQMTTSEVAAGRAGHSTDGYTAEHTGGAGQSGSGQAELGRGTHQLADVHVAEPTANAIEQKSVSEAIEGSGATSRVPDRVLEVFTGPDLESTRALRKQHPNANLVAAEKSFPPSAETRASFEAEGHTFLEEKFAQSLPPGSIDSTYVRYPLPHEKAIENTGPAVADAMSYEQKANPALGPGQAAQRAIDKVHGDIESVKNLGPHALEQLKVGGTLDIVMWEEKVIMQEISALTKRVMSIRTPERGLASSWSPDQRKSGGTLCRLRVSGFPPM